MATRRRTTQPRKRPRQERATVTVEAILRAAELVLERHGGRGLTTNRIAEVAGVSVGSVYQYFPNKESIAAALVDRYFGAQLSRFTEVLAGLQAAPLEQVVELVFRSLVAVHAQQPKIHQQLLEQLPWEAFYRTRAAVLARYSEAMARMLEARVSDHTVADIPAAVFLLVHAVEGAVEALGRADFSPADLERHVSEAARLFVGCLRAPR